MGMKPGRYKEIQIEAMDGLSVVAYVDAETNQLKNVSIGGFSDGCNCQNRHPDARDTVFDLAVQEKLDNGEYSTSTYIEVDGMAMPTVRAE